MTVLDHVTVTAADFAASLAFYDAALGALGLVRLAELVDEEEDAPVLEAAAWGPADAQGVVWLVSGLPATTGLHIQLRAESRQQVETFHDAVKAATQAAIKHATGRDGEVTCRCTHAYPDGVAPYFTFHAAGRHGALIEQWHAIKSAGLDAVIAGGGTVTHHHAVGRDHRPWYDRQRPPLFAEALKAAKRALDPRGLLNPGVLIDA